MPQSCRDVIKNIWTDSGTPIGTNAGLLRDRYLEFSVKDDKHKDARENLHQAIVEAMVHSMEIYQMAYVKSYSAIDISMPRVDGFFKTDGRMVIGLGGENVLETGLTLQHTFGTPLIPGSALKGLAAHYFDQVWGASDSRFKLGEEYHETIFGTTEDSGHVIFHDAWIVPESLIGSLKSDVMTPHHGDYYSKKDGAAPTDFDDPNPITFLSIVGSFHIVVSCDVQNEDGEKWAKLAFKILTEALREWGIGGKTNAGYGRLVLENLGEVDGPSSENTTDSKPPVPGPDVQRPSKPPQPAAKKLKYKKGDTVEVTKVADPKEKRSAAYFMADDGVGGQVVLGTPPSVEMGQKVRLEINGVMEKEGLYNFAAVGAKREPPRQARDKRGRR
ncbi:MAG: type III-B CRISPR module RAMP protein Cmr6 [Methanothrix sp.]|nr:type III-B CRISPR module RAMP protein Cmr6 [Methanothrix sp.]